MSSPAPPTPASPPAAIPVGDIQLFDRDTPTLYGGSYQITLAQALTGIDTGPIGATQKFVVSAPQVAIDASEVVQLSPADGSVGQFADVLPFVLLAEPALPWERAMPDPTQPWLAVLVFQDTELTGGAGSPTRATATTVGDFLALSDVLVPSIQRGPDVSTDQVCSYIEIPTAVFQAVTPRLTELRFLAHVRQVNTGDKAIAGVNEDGLFSVVVGNRFPVVASTGPGPVKNIAHLVSLEGLAPYLVDDPVFTKSGKSDGTTVFDTVAVLSLASWSFQVVADPAENFPGLMIDLLDAEFDPASGQHQPKNLWLGLPVPAVGGTDPNTTEVVNRIESGFVPLAYHTRTGEDTFAWYRGPLAPLLPATLDKPGPFLTGDAALIYDATHGVFDLSLAAAWQIGRATALSDRAFGQTLLAFRQRLHLLTDTLFDRLQRDHFDTPADLAQLAASNLLPKQLLSALDAQLLRDIAGGTPTAPQAPAPAEPPDTDPQTALENFLDDTATQQTILQIVADDLDPVAQWLAQLALLLPVPFAYLVPDPRMLPLSSPAAGDPTVPLPGALRFFYVDPNWIGALIDGALSIGLESSLQAFFHQMTSDVLQQAAIEAAKVLRGGGSTGTEVISGLLLRSDVVSGWPNLAVRPLDAAGQMLGILRMDHVAPGVLLCLFDGVPAQVMIAEPQEGFAFGTTPDGDVQLRNLVPPTHSGDPALGAPLSEMARIRDPSGQQSLCMRADNRVLNIDPGDPAGVIQSLVKQLGTAGQPVSLATFGPAAFALQMIRAPEQLTFQSGGTS